MGKNNFKKVVETVIVLIVIAIIVLFVGPNLVEWIHQYKLGRQETEAEDVKTQRERAAAYDNIGGQTPEQTLDMFLSALKENNTLKASQYYKALSQLGPLSKLQRELEENGNLNKSVTFFTEIRTKGIKRCDDKVYECVFDFNSKVVRLIRDNLSGVWKIEKS
ncbi:MAG: hypothetical protein HY226_03895 [Candidatus Vogelbacteria bacterium]|nr:hypothetical protein [Candidatus Vogelbacteria bacterium]